MIMRRQLRALTTLTMIVFAACLGACTSLPVDERSEVRDPYEETNRKIFAFNMAADSYVLEPVASGYRNVAPQPVQTAVANHVNWVACHLQL